MAVYIKKKNVATGRMFHDILANGEGLLLETFANSLCTCFYAI